ncbi:AAA family ATPase [Vibrio mangrovi]|uniref:AAA family ATPase n=1 Tax=Vibrio mangrovi TaxID=474394 RepID=A0A1Y6J220_9VIBR|nr:AAA family ATPase [Vibrio mangrovi]MDW6002349.1 AAA family ATPase [Vibrio mangrovi]SMS02752.1 Septum site-determining protein MinD [Vibrio mangrovi]
MNEAIKIVRDDNNQIRLKTALTIWVLYVSDAFRRHMTLQLNKCGSVNVEFLEQNPRMMDGLKRSLPDLIFVETGPNWAQRVIELQRVEFDGPEEHDISLIVFGDETDNHGLRLALRLGATDFISAQSTVEEFFSVLKNAAEEKVASRKLADILVFLNTKGGSGATTIALNTAVEVATHYPERVLILDLDMHFGVVMDYLNLTPVYSISDVVANLSDLDEISLQSLVTKHESGVHVLSFKAENHHENYEKAQFVGRLIPVLREYYDYIFVDFSGGVDHFFSPILTQAARIFLVTQQNLVAIKNTSKIAKTLAFDYGIDRAQMSLIVNRYEKRQQIKLKDIQQTISGIDVHMVPNDFKIAIESANLGRPVVSSKKSSSIAKSVVELAQLVSPDLKETKGWLKGLFS